MPRKSEIRINAEDALELVGIEPGRPFIDHRAYGTRIKISKRECPEPAIMERIRTRFANVYQENATEVSFTATPFYNGYAGIVFKVFK